MCPVFVLLEAHTLMLSSVILLHLCTKSDLLVPLHRRHWAQSASVDSMQGKLHCLLGAMSLHLRPSSRSLAAQVEDLDVVNGLVIELERCSAIWHNKSLRLSLVGIVSPLGTQHLCILHQERRRMHGKEPDRVYIQGEGVYSARQ